MALPFSEAEFEAAVQEWESESEAAEARFPIRKPSSQPSYKPRPAPTTQNYVTQAQLEAALSRSDGKIKTLSDGVGTLTTRVTAIGAAAKKEAEDRKKAVEAQNKDLNQKLQLLALLPVLVRPPSATLATPNNLLGPGRDLQAVSVPDNNNLNILLPLLLVTGLGGAGGIGMGDGGSSDGSSMLLLALVLAFATPRTN